MNSPAAVEPRRLGSGRVWPAMALVLLLNRSFFAAEALPTLERTSGELRPARFVGLAEDGRFRFTVEDETLELAAPEFASWGRLPDRPAVVWVLLTDGGRLAAQAAQWEGRQLLIDSGYGGERRLPLESVRAVLFQAPADSIERDEQIGQLLASSPKREGMRTLDELWLLNGDVIYGELLAPDPLPGDTNSRKMESGFSIRLGGGGRPLFVPAERIQAAIWSRRWNKPLPDSRSIGLGLRDGSLLWLRQVELRDRRVRTRGVADYEWDWGELEFRAAVAMIQPLGFGTEYLSDRAPLGFKHVPFWTQNWSFAPDRCVTGTPLRTGGQIWVKGVGLHSASRLAYELEGKYARFLAWTAIDDRARGLGNVVFRVFLERTADAATGATWEAVHASPVMRGGDPPLRVDVDVSQARRLALVVEFADEADVCDYANWLNARLVPK